MKTIRRGEFILYYFFFLMSGKNGFIKQVVPYCGEAAYKEENPDKRFCSFSQFDFTELKNQTPVTSLL
jgi:hypothetical protein